MVTIGKVVRVHGVRGEVKVRSYSDVPRRFEELKLVTVAGPAEGPCLLTVRDSRKAADGYLLAFEGIGSPEAAASLVGSLLQIPQERLAPLPDGRYYECDLQGMEVWTDDGTALGVIVDVLTTKSNAIFVVRGSRDVEHLIPGAKEIIREVDVAGRRMIVRRVEGLLSDESHDAL